MKKFKKVIAASLVGLMTASLIPVSAYAAQSTDDIASGTAYLNVNNEEWSDFDAEWTNAVIDGDGDYTVSMVASEPQDLALFSAVEIKDGELLFGNGYTVTVTSIRINGEEAKSGEGYTGSVDAMGISTRVNLYNEWADPPTVPDDTRCADGDLASKTNKMFDVSCLKGVKSMQVDFTVSGLGEVEESEEQTDWIYEVLDDGTIKLIWYMGEMGSWGMISVPAEVDGYKVSEIAQGCFNAYPELECIIIDGDMTIGANLFDSYSNLEDVRFNGNAVIMSDAFSDSSIKYIYFWGSTTIKENAFSGCSSLKKVEFRDSDERVVIESNAFNDCKLLETIYFWIGNNVAIEKNSFNGCDKAELVSMKKSEIYRFATKYGIKWKSWIEDLIGDGYKDMEAVHALIEAANEGDTITVETHQENNYIFFMSEDWDNIIDKKLDVICEYPDDEIIESVSLTWKDMHKFDNEHTGVPTEAIEESEWYYRLWITGDYKKETNSYEILYLPYISTVNLGGFEGFGYDMDKGFKVRINVSSTYKDGDIVCEVPMDDNWNYDYDNVANEGFLVKDGIVEINYDTVYSDKRYVVNPNATLKHTEPEYIDASDITASDKVE